MLACSAKGRGGLLGSQGPSLCDPRPGSGRIIGSLSVCDLHRFYNEQVGSVLGLSRYTDFLPTDNIICTVIFSDKARIGFSARDA